MTSTRSLHPPATSIAKPGAARASIGGEASAGVPGSSERGGEHAGPLDQFAPRHIGPDGRDIGAMLDTLGLDSLDALIDATIPAAIRLRRPLLLAGTTMPNGAARGEHELLAELRAVAGRNVVHQSFLGMGYYDTITPPVIQRNILENPGWYTQYTPYQAEIAQGRLEALLNFQTMVCDLTGLPVANASLLDEATAAAEAMGMCHAAFGGDEGRARSFLVSSDCHPQTIAVVKTRGRSLGVNVVVRDLADVASGGSGSAGSGIEGVCGVMVQYPATDGRIVDYSEVVSSSHAAGALVVCATDLLACTLIAPPGEWGADIVVGSAQRFGVPMGFGGPHAAFMATRSELVRKMPGRLIGVSRDAHGNVAYRMAIQTREQHIKRERATSNICTAQVLLAIMAGMYAVYHGPEGLTRIARRVHEFARGFAEAVASRGHEVVHSAYFDTVRVKLRGCSSTDVVAACLDGRMNVRVFGSGDVGVSFDETTSVADADRLAGCFAGEGGAARARASGGTAGIGTGGSAGERGVLNRTSKFLEHPVFNTHHSETEMLRYITRLQSRDLSLAQSMIALGSCTMKLNGTSEMLPVTWPEFSRMHPFAPREQWQGYGEMFRRLEEWLAEMTGFAAVSLQPNAGSQGEYAGLLAIRGYHESRGEGKRDVCLIPVSAHGTNPASAVIAGMRVFAVACDDKGNVDVDDLRDKSAAHRSDLSCLMITYPSTHGVFEESIKDICAIVHEHGGQVYMDGANMNAQVGLCRPGDIGADVCHLNLHKTFCIPHGGGGPGMGPIAVAKHLEKFLPSDPIGHGDGDGDGAGAAQGRRPADTRGSMHMVGAVSAAAYGSASILPISYVYIALMGAAGLKRATEVAILNANYMARRLEDHYDVLYANHNGRVAHEFIIDCRAFKDSADISVDDIAKRLMDYGFHAPTMSFPVAGTLMIEPTESESKAELDRFCDAMIAIRQEIREIEHGSADRKDNVLKHAPHTIAVVSADAWPHAYAREQAAFPAGAPWLREHKFWPHVGRIDNPYGDRNLMCTCPPMSEA